MTGAAVAMMVAGSALSCATSAPHAREAPVARFGRVAVAYSGARIDPRHEARRLAVWIAQGPARRQLAAMRRVPTPALALLYKEAIYADLSNRSRADAAGNPGGVSAREVRAHPAWVLRDAGGRQIRNPSYAPYALLDIGDPSYQRAWAANVARQARRDGWSGVFADDLALALTGASAVPARYPTPGAWQAAVRRFVAATGPRLRRAGIRIVTNTSSGVSFPGARRALVRLADGTMEEGWMRPDGDARSPLATTPGAWDRQLEELADAERAGKLFIAELPASGGDRRAVRYALASFLLAADGHGVFAVSGAPPHRRALWFSDYERARRLGQPLAAASTLAQGLRARRFERGLVLVNPTTGTIAVRPGEFPGLDVPSELPPATGLIVQSASTG